MHGSIQPHNQRPAAVWSSGGLAYDEISRQIASALDHCVRRLDPKPGERILDLATGTGWTSRLLAARGAKVTGVDIAADLIDAAKVIGQSSGLVIDYEIGDAERLRFADASFDAVVSTFGVMFASNPEAAAGEIARVCRKGGRIALTTWRPDSNVFEMFKVMQKYMPSPPSPSPFAWGSRDRIKELFGSKFDLGFEDGETIYYERSGEAAWHAFVSGYGPTKALAASLDEKRRNDLKRDFVAFHDGFAAPLGIAMPRQYLLTVGTRR
ncbi:MAG TPA: methyltransferase domain-containing protein [Xanthobacteraceae bacterium]|nr:methyltransferase domain-containing protein [Xanthobacteraceae bacterium]